MILDDLVGPTVITWALISRERSPTEFRDSTPGEDRDIPSMRRVPYAVANSEM